MSSFKPCPICKEFGWFGQGIQHKCAPQWECRMEWDSELDWQIVHSMDAERAVEKFADRYDCEGDYPILQNRGDKQCVVLVRKPTGPESEAPYPYERYSVEGESVPQYHARKIEAA